jgi:hypothetical protein
MDCLIAVLSAVLSVSTDYAAAKCMLHLARPTLAAAALTIAGTALVLLCLAGNSALP